MSYVAELVNTKSLDDLFDGTCQNKIPIICGKLTLIICTNDSSTSIIQRNDFHGTLHLHSHIAEVPHCHFGRYDSDNRKFHNKRHFNVHCTQRKFR